jgi:hypothetical protein
MKYERLTKYNEYSHNAEVYAYSVDKDVYFDGVDIVGNENSSLAQEVIDRLAELEDKIENGTLLELPCKVGDTVWEIIQSPNGNFISKEIIGDYWITEDRIVARTGLYSTDSIEIEEFGKTVFLTKAEAEQKLKEKIRNESNI